MYLVWEGVTVATAQERKSYRRLWYYSVPYSVYVFMSLRINGREPMGFSFCQAEEVGRHGQVRGQEASRVGRASLPLQPSVLAVRPFSSTSLDSPNKLGIFFYGIPPPLSNPCYAYGAVALRARLQKLKGSSTPPSRPGPAWPDPQHQAARHPTPWLPDWPARCLQDEPGDRLHSYSQGGLSNLPGRGIWCGEGAQQGKKPRAGGIDNRSAKLGAGRAAQTQKLRAVYAARAGCLSHSASLQTGERRAAEMKGCLLGEYGESSPSVALAWLGRRNSSSQKLRCQHLVYTFACADSRRRTAQDAAPLAHVSIHPAVTPFPVASPPSSCSYSLSSPRTHKNA